MKLAKFILLAISLLFAGLPLQSVNAYSGGLLDGKAVNIGIRAGTPGNTTTEVTDNNLTTAYFLPTGSDDDIVKDIMWYRFETPKDIDGYILKSFDNNKINIGFVDTNGAHFTIDPAEENYIKTTITKRKNIVMVYLWSENSASNQNIYEWDVFGVDSTTSLTATGDVGAINLNWAGLPWANQYIILRAETPGGPYLEISSSAGTSFVDLNVVGGKEYYYVVQPVYNTIPTVFSNEASAIPISPPVVGRALLTITMTNGLEKEYDLSMTQVDAFIVWYDTKDAGSGPAKYAFTKTWNKGPFTSRTEYVIFDKILTFNVDEYIPNEEAVQ